MKINKEYFENLQKWTGLYVTSCDGKYHIHTEPSNYFQSYIYHSYSKREALGFLEGYYYSERTLAEA